MIRVLAVALLFSLLAPGCGEPDIDYPECPWEYYGNRGYFCNPFTYEDIEQTNGTLYTCVEEPHHSDVPPDSQGLLTLLELVRLEGHICSDYIPAYPERWKDQSACTVYVDIEKKCLASGECHSLRKYCR